MEQQLEFILRDILDDLKALRVSKAEQQSDSVNIANRLNAFEKWLKEQKQTLSTINTKQVEDVMSKELFQLRNFIVTQNVTNALNTIIIYIKGYMLLLS